MREHNVPEKYVKLIQDMYRVYQTKVRSAESESGSFNVEVGLHQRSALRPHLFLILMAVSMRNRCGVSKKTTRIHDVCGRHCTLWR